VNTMRAEVRTPSGEVLLLDVENYYVENNRVEIASKDGKYYLTDLANVLLVFENGGEEARSPQPETSEAGTGFAVDKTAVANGLVELVGKLGWQFVDDGNGVLAKATLENTTGQDISGLTIKVDLWADGDKPVESQTLYVTDWKKGEKTELTFRTHQKFTGYSSWLESYIL